MWTIGIYVAVAASYVWGAIFGEAGHELFSKVVWPAIVLAFKLLGM